MKFLLDNCLAPSLVEIASGFGYSSSVHVQSLKLSDSTDIELTEYAIKNNFVFVTRDSDDYRARPGSVQHSQCYLGKYNHPGLMCINMPYNARKQQHQLFFKAALMVIENYEDLTNTVVETNWTNEANELIVCVEVYVFPTNSRNISIDRYSIQFDGVNLTMIGTSNQDV